MTFEQLGIPKNMTIGIDRVTESISTRDSSHQGSWEFILKSQLNHIGYDDVHIVRPCQTWKDFNYVLISHGMNFKGSFNVFGGATDELANRLNRFFDLPTTRLISYEISIPDVGEWIQKRQKTCSQGFAELNSKTFTSICKNIRSVDSIFKCGKLVFGDSHALSVYRKGYMISRNDGLTLYRALEDGLLSRIPFGLDHLIFYLGNIDIRFHLHDKGIVAIGQLVNHLEHQLKSLEAKNISVVAPLFIENESRKLPGTGLYKGQPFFGNWELREALRYALTSGLSVMCADNGWELITWPESYKNDKRELRFDVMEAKQSVHIARHSYIGDL